ncbi:unnamed protein product [Oikopleura dioica]|uniref:Uncharacterized protein n=1 Tax=Oikopleura dioica TaxID=34765 RepID=E4XUJ9_OIKDI|nr:unnamed protein product [Oikopleura dioica]
MSGYFSSSRIDDWPNIEEDITDVNTEASFQSMSMTSKTGSDVYQKGYYYSVSELGWKSEKMRCEGLKRDKEVIDFFSREKMISSAFKIFSKRDARNLDAFVQQLKNQYPYGIEEYNFHKILESKRYAYLLIGELNEARNRSPDETPLWRVDAFIEILKHCRVFNLTFSTVGFIPQNLDLHECSKLAENMIQAEQLGQMDDNSLVCFLCDRYFERCCLRLNELRGENNHLPTIRDLASRMRLDRIANSLLIKLHILLDKADDLMKRNKKKKVTKAYDVFCTHQLKQSPESLPESHERMLQYLVRSPYSSRWNGATSYKDRRADLDETIIKPTGLTSVPDYVWERIKKGIGSSLSQDEIASIGSENDQQLWKENKWTFFEQAKTRNVATNKVYLNRVRTSFVNSCRKISVRLLHSQVRKKQKEVERELAEFSKVRVKEFECVPGGKPTVNLPQPFSIEGREHHLKPGMMVLLRDPSTNDFYRVVLETGRWFELYHDSYFERRRQFFKDATPEIAPTRTEKKWMNDSHKIKYYYVDFGYSDTTYPRFLYFAPKVFFQYPAFACPILMADCHIGTERRDELTELSDFCVDVNWSKCERYNYLMRYVTEPKASDEDNNEDNKSTTESTDLKKYPTMNVRLLTDHFHDSNKNPIDPIGLFVIPEKVNFGMDGHEPCKPKEYINFRMTSVSKKYGWTCAKLQQSE